ncbi:MAG TPA: hypothetical protein PLA68_06970 [Panacibacter sp.]|nr:hypothetical protein [Panacibacter sp.]
MRKLFIIALIVVSSTANAQRKQLETDVFVLNACSPTEIAIFRDSSQLKQINANRLSINVNRFSAFKIKNINPLRYNFYINDILITQFFDANDITSSGSTKGTNRLQANDIKILNLFDIGDIKNSQFKKVDSIETLIQRYQDSIDLNDAKYDSLMNIKDTLYYLDSNENKIKISKGGKEIVDKVDAQLRTLNAQYTWFSSKLDNIYLFYNTLINNLYINGNFSSLIKGIISASKSSFDSASENSSLKSSQERIVLIAEDALKKCDNLDSIIKKFNFLLAKESSNNNSKTKEIDSIIEDLSAKGFLINSSSDKRTFRNKIFKLKKEISDKKLSEIQSFVLFTALEVGKQLQNAVINESRFENLLKQETCIDTFRVQIYRHLKNDSSLYLYIQDVCAYLNVLIKYLELDNTVFTDPVKNINTNFATFLNYIKTLDFVDKNNTREYTLPTYNNLKNIDLIRYQIDREDILTKSKQTYNYDIWLKGGIKIDFSGGIFLSQLKDEVFNKNAVYDTVGSDVIARTDSLFIDKQNSGKYQFAFGGMVNMSLRSGVNWITPGISLGIGYSNTTQLQFMGAINFQLGKTERIILHLGFAGGEVKRLDLSQITFNPKTDVFMSGNRYKIKADASNYSLPYIDKFSFKPFFGISYNLSKKNALQAVSGKGVDKFNSLQNGSGTNTGTTATP